MNYLSTYGSTYLAYVPTCTVDTLPSVLGSLVTVSRAERWGSLIEEVPASSIYTYILPTLNTLPCLPYLTLINPHHP